MSKNVNLAKSDISSLFEQLESVSREAKQEEKKRRDYVESSVSDISSLFENLEEASKDRLVIIIAHRLSTIAKADKVIFLEDGEIQESGSPQELLANKDSLYRRYVDLQTNSDFISVLPLTIVGADGLYTVGKNGGEYEGKNYNIFADKSVAPRQGTAGVYHNWLLAEAVKIE